MRALVACLGFVLVACAPARRTWHPQPPAPGAASPSAYAIVLRSTPLAIAPRAGAPSIWPELARSDAAPSFTVFRIVGEENGFAALETLADETPHCAGTIGALDAFRLRLYVPVTALVPVTQREVAQPFADGTRIELARGVPLEPLPQRGLFRAHLGDVSTVVQLGLLDVGTRYLPSAELARPAVDRALRGDALAAAVPVLGQTGRVEASAATDRPVYEVTPRGGELIAELRPRCARIIVRVPPHAVIEAAPSQADAASMPASASLFVRAGAPVRWRDGTPAGVVRRDAALGAESEPVERLRCFVVALREDDPSAAVQLCFDRRDVADPSVGLGEVLDAPTR